MNYGIIKEKQGVQAYFTISWSPFVRLDKKRIRALIPAEAGIFQFFSRKGSSLELIGTYKTYYGGLRATFLEILDEDCQVAFPDKVRLREEETYLRYSVSSSRDDLNDVIHHFTGSEPSERNLEIMVEEKDCMKLAR